jgi:beta-mannanase
MALVMILGSTIQTQAAPAAQTTGPSIYWGALVDGKVPSSTNLQGIFATFETRSKKKMSIIHWGQPWMMGDGSWGEFQTTYFQNVRNHGSIPMLNWNSWRLGAGSNQPDFQLRDVYGGRYDTYLRRWATAAKNWGHPFFLRFNHEMNGWWYPWGEGKLSNGTIVNGNSAGDYVKAWRHVHDLFESVGATNITWVWAPNHISTSSQYPPALSTLYPGDAYVDWTGLSAYNKYPTWLGINSLLTGSGGITWLKNSYNIMLNTAPTKPMMLAETASIEAGDGGTKKAAWITDALATQIPINFPKIKAIVWLNWAVNGKTYPIQSSQAATDAWANGIGSTKYAANRYASLNTSPIPAPAALTLSGASEVLEDSPTEAAPTLVASPTTAPATIVASPTLASSPTIAPATPVSSPTSAPATVAASPTAASITVTAVADSYIDSANPASKAGGASATLFVNASPVQTTFLKFDLTLLAGKTVSTVKLKFKTTSDTAAGSTNSSNLKLVRDVLWKEKHLSYGNTVPISDTLLGIVPANSTPNTWYEISLEPSIIQQNLGSLISVAIESTGSDALLLYSREATDQPQLIITYP